MTHSRDRYPTPPTFPIADTGLLLAGHAMAVADPDYDNSTLVSDEIWLDRPPELAAALTVQIKRFRSRAGSSESGHVPDS